MPKQGVSSTFKFGKAYGVVIGVVAALKIPVHFVAPSVWKRHFGLSADKEEARARALQYWPERAELFARKKDHGRAEAALLARYAAERIVNGGGRMTVAVMVTGSMFRAAVQKTAKSARSIPARP